MNDKRGAMDDQTRILVVDDEKVVREGCRRVLTAKGYRVDEAENGQAALEQLEKGPADVILLDLKMPGLSGEQVLERCREQYPDIPVIIITGHGTVDTAVECMKRGAYDFITKPFQMDPFLLTIGRAAEKRRLERQARRFQEENIRNLYDLDLEKSRLKTIINCMANGVLVTNRNLEVVLRNPAIMRLLEVDEPAERPIPLARIVQNPDFQETLRQIQSGELPEGGVFSQELGVGKRVVRAISAPALAPDGQISGTVTVMEDVTPFKQLDQMKTDFVNMVAHELRSPLVSIRQQNSVLLEGLAGPLLEKQNEFIRRGMQKIDSLLELINDLLDLAKIEAGHAVQQQQPTDVCGIITNMVVLMEPRARDQKIRLVHSCKGMRPILADPKRIEELFNNLITNAINYSPDGGEVSITAEGHDAYLEIRVSDTGVGIPKEELPKIFDKFYRVKSPKTRKVLGTGLGLSIVMGIVEAHRGTIDVESEVDRGTTFRILLPVISEA